MSRPLPFRLLPGALLLVGAGLLSPALQAQTAGMELQGRVPVQPLPADPLALPALPTAGSGAPALPAGDTRSIELSAVRFEGREALDEARLQQAVGPVAGRRFNLGQLVELAERVTALYRAEGFPLAQALVPAQRLEGGVLLLQVVEGRIGSVRALGDDPKAAGAQPFLEAGVPVGVAVSSRSLERTMLLLDDQPGFRVRPVLRPGATFGSTDLDVNLTRRNRASGELGLDNTGNLGTGEYRVRGTLNLNSPLRFGDRLGVSVLATDRKLWLGSAEYETPVDARGTRAAIGLSRSNYELGGAFAALGANGLADTLSLRVSHAWVRSQQANLVLTASAQRKLLEQRFDAVDLQSDRASRALGFGLQFDRRDGWAGGGVSFGQATLTTGSLSLDAEAAAQDAVTARTVGGFTKLSLDLARIQRLPGPFSAYGRLSAQWTPENLDASEKFAAGGFLGVRAYPLGEASGDRGWLAQTELRLAVLPEATVFLAADAGQAQLNARPWDAASAQRRSIAGAGAGLRWVQPGWTLESVLSWSVRGGPAEAESRDRDPRLFVVGSVRFD